MIVLCAAPAIISSFIIAVCFFTFFRKCFLINIFFMSIASEAATLFEGLLKKSRGRDARATALLVVYVVRETFTYFVNFFIFLSKLQRLGRH